MSERNRAPTGRTARTLALVAAVAAAYYVGARVGLLLALVGDQVTPLWPPTGIALVALLVFGRRAMPGITLGAFLVNAPLGPSILAAAAIAAGNTLAPAAAYEMLRRMGSGASLDRLRDAVLLILGAFTAMTISATVGTGVLLAAGAVSAGSFWGTWSVWWAGDVMGVLVVAPLLLMLRSARSLSTLSWSRRAEAAAILLATTIVTMVVTRSSLPMLYLVVPFVIWGAVRFRMAGAAPTVAIASCITILAAANQTGLFRSTGLLSTMIILQAFNASIGLIGFLLAAVTAERDRARAALEAAGAALEERVHVRTTALSAAVERLERSEAMLEEAQRCAHIGSWEWDIATNEVIWSDELYRLFGLEPGSIRVDYQEFLARVHPDDRPMVEDVVERAYRDAEPFSFDHRVVWPDGSVHWMHGSGSVAVDPGGAPVRMLGTGQDIEAQKRAEAAAQRLHDAEIRRRQALELNDEIVQGLSLAAYASDSGDTDMAARAIRGTLTAARHIVAELLGDDDEGLAAGDLVREHPAQAPWKKTG